MAKRDLAQMICSNSKQNTKQATQNICKYCPSFAKNPYEELFPQDWLLGIKALLLLMFPEIKT
jgi:hypothetical protein